MLERYQYLAKIYNKKKDYKILLDILSMFNIILPNDLDFSSLEIYLNDDSLELYESHTPSIYKVIIFEDSYHTYHDFNDYVIAKVYNNDSNQAFKKELTIIQNKDEKIVYNETYSEIPTICIRKYIASKLIFQKTIYYDKENGISCVSTDIRERNINRHTIKYDRKKEFCYFDIRNFEDEYVETSFINDVIDTSDKNSLDSISILLNMQTALINIETSFSDPLDPTELEVYKVKHKISLFIYGTTLEGKKILLREGYIASNDKHTITHDDIDAIIDFVSVTLGPETKIMKQLENIKKAYLKNKIYKQAKSDGIDTFYFDIENKIFNNVAFEIYKNKEFIDESIKHEITKNEKKLALDLKKQ